MIKTHSHIISDALLTRVIKNAFNAGHNYGGEYVSGNHVDVARRNAIKNAKRAIRREAKTWEMPSL